MYTPEANRQGHLLKCAKVPKGKASKHNSTIKLMGIFYAYELVASYFLYHVTRN